MTKKRTLISRSTLSPKEENTVASTSSLGASSVRDALATARMAGPEVECRCRYCEFEVSRDTPSGKMVGNAALTTVPMGAGGG